MMKPIVYVDDEIMICRLLQMLAQRAGVTIEVFTDPEAALRYVAEHEVAAVLCDYRMPNVSGMEVILRLPPEIPAYLVTGDISLDEATRRHPRVRAVLNKPVRPEDLLALFREISGTT